MIYCKEQDPENRQGQYPLFAPDVCQGRDGKYYLYYAPAGSNTIGVAVSDTPVRPFEFHGHVIHEDGRLACRQDGDPIPFDPGVLVDDDDRIYLYLGFVPHGGKPFSSIRQISGPFVVELRKDMHTMIGVPQTVVIEGVPEKLEDELNGHDFFEASSMRKINGTYCFIYSSQNGHELCYATGSSPKGPFTYRGVLHSNGDIGIQGRREKDRLNYTGNNHGSLIEINGSWYVFGHRMTNYTAYSRQAVAEPVEILPDGSIAQAEMTSCGLNGGPLLGTGTYNAGIACILYAQKGARHVFDPEFKVNHDDHPAFMQDAAEDFDDFRVGENGEPHEENADSIHFAQKMPRQYIGNMKDGAVAGFKYFQLGDTKNISVTTRGDGGLLKVYTDLDKIPAAEIPLAEGKDWHTSPTVRLSGMKGVQALYFTVNTDGALDFLEFELS